MTVVENSPEVRTPLLVWLLTALAAVLFAVGWLVGKVSIPVGWMWAAVRVGWSDARGEEV